METTLTGGSSSNNPEQKNGSDDAGCALPCDSSSGHLTPGLDTAAVWFRALHAKCSLSAQRILNDDSSACEKRMGTWGASDKCGVLNDV